MDYSTMYHILLEYSITLHVFNDELFDIPKAKERSKLYGETTEALICNGIRRHGFIGCWRLLFSFVFCEGDRDHYAFCLVKYSVLIVSAWIGSVPGIL